MTSLFGGNADQTNTNPFGGAFSFGAPATVPATSLTSQAGTSNNLFGASTSTTGFGVTTTSAPSLFAAPATSTFSSSLLPNSSGSTSAFTGLPQTSAPSTAGFSFSGFGNPTTSASLFGTGSLISSTPTVTTTTASIGLGGVDIQTSSGLNGTNTASKKDGKTVKETQIPNEMSFTVESFKKYVKEQKAIREEMSRVSGKNLFKVQELVATLKQQLSVVSNGLHRNAVAIAKLKEESNEELKNAEIAQRTKDALQYENNAPTEYFHNLANSFEKQMQSYRQQIEQLERHLLSLSQPYALTPAEWTAIRKRLHDTFVTLAAQLQTVHQEVQLYKEHFINSQRLSHGDMRLFMEKCKENMKDFQLVSYLPPSVTYGPSPFAAVQSAVGKAITNVFNHSQQFPGGSSATSLSGFEYGASNRLISLAAKRISFQSVSPFKPLGTTGLAPFGSTNAGDAGFSADASQSQFGLNNPKPFQLQKPPAGNKRGKRWTST